MQITKHTLLARTENGLRFYTFVLPDLKIRGNRCENIRNPFYEDKNASLSIFRKDGTWMFKDFGNDAYQGDVFTFAAHFYNLSVKSDFQEILRTINRDLRLNLDEDKPEKPHADISKQLSFIKRNSKNQAKDYLKSRGILNAKAFLQSNAYKQFPAGVVFLNHTETGYETRFINAETPAESAFHPKTKYHGTKSDTLYIGAYNQNSDEVFICESAINALSFAEIGRSAISTFGATNIPKLEILKPFIRNKTVFLAGDRDSAGQSFNGNFFKLVSSEKSLAKDIFILEFPDGTDAKLICIFFFKKFTLSLNFVKKICIFA